MCVCVCVCVRVCVCVSVYIILIIYIHNYIRTHTCMNCIATYTHTYILCISVSVLICTYHLQDVHVPTIHTYQCTCSVKGSVRLIQCVDPVEDMSTPGGRHDTPHSLRSVVNHLSHTTCGRELSST